jgi:tetratricopeptide (TPR) repeat protein
LVYVDGTLKLAQLAAQTAAADSRSTAVMEQAAQHLAELATQVPNDPWLLLQRALIARRRGLDKETTESLAAIQQIAPRTLPPRLLLATAAAQNGHVEIALAEAQRATQESPTHAGAWFVLGRWLLNADQPDQALPAFQHADGLRPDWGSPRILAGEACRRLQRYDQALTLTASATNNPALARLALLSLADIHNAAGHTNEAVTLYQRFLQDDPDHHIAANNLAELLAARGDLPAALALADRLEQLFPTVVPILDTVGWIRHRAGQHAAASRLLREAIRLAPALGIAHFHLGQVLLAQGQKAEAATAFRRALECPLSPADRQAAEQALAALPQ